MHWAQTEKQEIQIIYYYYQKHRQTLQLIGVVKHERLRILQMFKVQLDTTRSNLTWSGHLWAGITIAGLQRSPPN